MPCQAGPHLEVPEWVKRQREWGKHRQEPCFGFHRKEQVRQNKQA